MIRNQRRVAIRAIDKELKTIRKTVDAWQKIRKAATKPEDIANADQAIKRLVSQAMSLFLKRKSLYLNKPMAQ
jgi:uncharacterized membrane protein (DUF106 family)